MSNAVAYNDLTDAEREEREAMRRAWGIASKAGADVIPMRRAPLGLAPAPDDGPGSSLGPDDMAEDGSVILSDGLRFSFMDNVKAEVLASAATVELVYQLGNALISTADTTMQKARELVADLRREIEGKLAGSAIRELQLERERDRATIAEMRSKIAELDFVVERLKIENKGPPGPKGERGRDGRDGKGLMGARGEPGPRGSPAPMIVGWRIDTDRYLVTPQYGDGSAGPPLNLSAFVGDDDEEGDE